MKFVAKWIFLVVVMMACKLNAAIIYQQETGVLAFEAEDSPSLSTIGSGSMFHVITTSTGVRTLPADTQAVGGSGIYAHRTGGEVGFATYQLAFTSDGNYYLYARYSNMEVSDNSGYGNEDSYYSPKVFNQPPSTVESEWNNESLSAQGHSPLLNPNDGKYFYWDKGASSYSITGASEESPVFVEFTIRIREGGVVLDRFVFSTTNYTLSGGVNTALDAIVSVPEPDKTVLSALALMGLIMGRRRKKWAV